jgi:site-specific DNA recombinase
MTTTTARRPKMRDAGPLPATKRVAVYVRKSTEKGLDQAFTSLDAQAQTIRAYIESRRHEGWCALPEVYSDGGFSGGTTDRPALQRLISDVESGKVDAIVVYRYDRLSRSILDFSRLLDMLEKRGVAFASVSEQFDTSTSTGRLFMNMLMSFAEYERRLIAERTRDKIAASRRKGLWVGGVPPLGYDVVEKRLVVNETEAKEAREILRLYLDLGSLLATAEELNRRGLRTKGRTTRKGRTLPGRPFDKSSVHRLLTHPLLVGKVPHGDDLFDGVHSPIIDKATWDAVQDRLRTGARTKARSLNNGKSLLRGLLRCGTCGTSMIAHYASRGTRRYHYYVCTTLQKRGAAACPGSRVPGREIESFLIQRLWEIGKDQALVKETIDAAKRNAEAKKPELIAEVRRLESETRRLAAERKNLLDAVAQGGAATGVLLERVGQVDQALKDAATRVEEARLALVQLETTVIDEADLKAAVASFEPLWEQLFLKEQARILALLIDTVTYHASTGDVAITFRPGGIRILSADSTRRTPCRS